MTEVRYLAFTISALVPGRLLVRISVSAVSARRVSSSKESATVHSSDFLPSNATRIALSLVLEIDSFGLLSRLKVIPPFVEVFLRDTSIYFALL